MSQAPTPRLARGFLLAFGAALAGCDTPDYQTENGQLGLRVDGLHGQVLERPATQLEAVTGSNVCVEFHGWFEPDGATYHIRNGEDDDSWLRDCFDLRAAAGSGLDDTGCLALEGPGSTAMELLPKPCELDASFTSDRLPVTSHALEDLALAFDDPAVRVIYDDLHPGPAGTFGPRPEPVSGTPLPVLAGGTFVVFPQPVVLADPTRTVGFSDGVAVAVGDDPPASFSAKDDGSAAFEIAADQRFTVGLELPAGMLVGGELVGVDGSAAVTLELVVGYTRCAACDDGYGVPSYALAIARDDADARLFGPQVTWTFEDATAGLATDTPLLADAVGFSEPCAEGDVGVRKTGTLRASYRELTATASIDFVCPEAGTQDAWAVEVIDDAAELGVGCACSANGSRIPVGATLAVLLLGLLSRRRRAPRPVDPRLAAA